MATNENFGMNSAKTNGLQAGNRTRNIPNTNKNC